MRAFNNYENIGSANDHHHHHGVEDMIEENEPIFSGLDISRYRSFGAGLPRSPELHPNRFIHPWENKKERKSGLVGEAIDAFGSCRAHLSVVLESN